MTQEYDGYVLDDSLARIDFERVHGWLASSYWSPGVTRERVERAANNSSLVIGAYRGETQIGYLRVVSDKTTFAWICDVWVAEEARGLGIGRSMVRFAQQHPDHQALRRWILATKDAHDVYKEAGFEPLPAPDKWMIHIPNPGGQPNIE